MNFKRKKEKRCCLAYKTIQISHSDYKENATRIKIAFVGFFHNKYCLLLNSYFWNGNFCRILVDDLKTEW